MMTIQQRWSADGILVLRAALSPAANQELVAELGRIFETSGDPGHALIPMVRGARNVIDDPIVSGVLATVLGANYILDECRHVHLNDSVGHGDWHQDDYCGKPLPEDRAGWAMICYFPQDTPPELGPTAFMSLGGGEVLASGGAGTFALARIDLWHRATGNRLGRTRFMLKFLFRQWTNGLS